MAETNSGASRRHLSRRSQESAAVINKLIRPAHVSSGGTNNTTATVPDQHELMPLVREQMQRRMDADNVFDVLPDVQFAADIVISSILSSKDLITTTLIYECTSNTLPIELKTDMLKVVQDYFTKTKPLKTFLYDMLFAAMYKTGSYIVGIIPESSVDRIINDGGKISLEDNRAKSIHSQLATALAPVGIVGPIERKAENGKAVGLEAFFEHVAVPTKDELTFSVGDGAVTITDNVDVLKLPKLHKKILDSRSKARTQIAMESAGLQFTYYDKDVYKDRSYKHKNVEEVRPVEDSERLTVGHPLEQIFPSESIVPVTVPGNVKHHMGYLCVLDDLGYPISKHSLMNNAAAVSWIFGNPSSASLDDAAKGLGFGDRPDNEKWTAAKLVESYTELVEAKLIASLKNGGFGDSVNLVKPQEVYRIMMARALAKKHTQILYIPAEQMCYFALDYDDFGIGRSLIDKTRLTGTIRTAMMMATMQASVLNATRETEYTITLDQKDRNAEKTIRNIEQSIMEAFANDIPYSGTPDDMAAYFSRAGVRFNIEGNDFYPSTKVSKNDNNPDYKPPEKESEEMYQRLHLRGLLADPDTIMNPENIEFASQITSKSILNARRIVNVQERISPQITHYVKTYTISDGILLRKLAGLARDYYSAEATAKRAEAAKKQEATDNALDPANLESEKVEGGDTSNSYPFGGESDSGSDTESGMDLDMDAYEDYGADPQNSEQRTRARINQAVSNFIETISIQLPAPDVSMLNSQKQAFDDRVEALDKFLEHLITEDFTRGTSYEGDVDRARGMVKSYLLRVWMRNNDVDRDLQDLFEGDNVEEILANVVDNNISHADWVIRLLKKQDARHETLVKSRDSDGTLTAEAGSGDSGGDSGDGSGGDYGDYDAGGNDDTGAGSDDTGAGGDADSADGMDDFSFDDGGVEDEAAATTENAEGTDNGEGDENATADNAGEDEGDVAHAETNAELPDNDETDGVVDLDEHGTLADTEAEQANAGEKSEDENKQDNEPAEKKPEEKPEEKSAEEKPNEEPKKEEPKKEGA